MQATLRKFDSTGKVDFGWLQSSHSFSFGHYHDPNWMQFGALRVINNDHVAPSAGFDPHSHKEMEILTYVLKGTIEHGDNFGQQSALVPAGSFQLISAGTGMTHSEYNPSKTEPLHFLQIWIIPNQNGQAPEYQQLDLSTDTTKATLILSPDGKNESMRIKQDMTLTRIRLAKDEVYVVEVTDKTRKLWLQQVHGASTVHANNTLSEGDGIGLEDLISVEIKADTDNTELLVFDLAA